MGNKKEKSEDGESVSIDSIIESRTSSKSKNPQYDVGELVESREKSDLTMKITRLFSINGLSYLIGISMAVFLSLSIAVNSAEFIFPPDYEIGGQIYYSSAQRDRVEYLSLLITVIGTLLISAIGYRLKSKQIISSVQIIGISAYVIISILLVFRNIAALLSFNLIILIPLLLYFNYYK